jgi:hypothetical protein
MFRFNDHDLFLVSLAAAFAVGWRVEQKALAASRTPAEQLRGALSVSKLNTDVYVNKLNGTPLSCGTIFPIDWELAEQVWCGRGSA